MYTVVTARKVAKEMARYQDAEFEELEFVRLGRIHPITNEAEAKEKVAECFGSECMDSMLEYRFRFTGNPDPRWLSFGVKVVKDEN